MIKYIFDSLGLLSVRALIQWEINRVMIPHFCLTMSWLLIYYQVTWMILTASSEELIQINPTKINVRMLKHALNFTELFQGHRLDSANSLHFIMFGLLC